MWIMKHMRFRLTTTMRFFRAPYVLHCLSHHLSAADRKKYRMPFYLVVPKDKRGNALQYYVQQHERSHSTQAPLPPSIFIWKLVDSVRLNLSINEDTFSRVGGTRRYCVHSTCCYSTQRNDPSVLGETRNSSEY